MHGDRLLLYGGHTVVVDPQDRSEREVVHDDLWALDLSTFQVRRRISVLCAAALRLARSRTPGMT